jgi:hypothetical protein
MVKRSRKNVRRNRRTRKSMKGGGFGFTGTNSIPGTPGTVSNPQVFTALGDCRATEPGYWIPQSSYAQYQKGLPGMNGGRRRTNRKQRGGRYTFDLSQGSVNGVSPNASTWWAGTYPPVQRIACEGSTPNPLNPGPHTPSTQPLPVASANLHLNPQSGGGTSPGTVGVGDVDSMYYYAPTAGYDNKPSTWVDSVGAPVQLQIPYAARELNPSCLTTGHPPPLTGALQKGGGIFNALTNGLKKVTNTVGLTRKNNSVNAAVGSVYNAVAPLTQNTNANSVSTGTSSNLSVYNVNNQRVNRNQNTNSQSAYTSIYENIENNRGNLLSEANSNVYYYNNNNGHLNNFENSVGGKRRRNRKSKKSRKGRKGNRKH